MKKILFIACYFLINTALAQNFSGGFIPYPNTIPVNQNNKNIIWHTLENTSGIRQYPKIKDNNITISEDKQHSHAGSFNKTRLSEIHDIGNNILQTFAKQI
mgnify:CR=1 FL=1